MYVQDAAETLSGARGAPAGAFAAPLGWEATAHIGESMGDVQGYPLSMERNTRWEVTNYLCVFQMSRSE